MKNLQIVLIAIFLIATQGVGNGQKRLEMYGDGIVNQGDKIIKTNEPGHLVLGDISIAGKLDNWLMKIDEFGKVKWLAGNGYKTMFNYYQAANGNIFTIGSKGGSFRNIFYAAFDANGTMIWEVNADAGFAPSQPLTPGVLPTSDGNTIFYYGKVDLNGRYQGVVTKVDNIGTTLWTQTIADPNFNYFVSDVQEDSSGEFIAVGSKGVQESFLTKITNSGAIAAQYDFNFIDVPTTGQSIPREERPKQFHIESDGYVFFGISWVADANGTLSPSKVFLSKVNLTGSVIFAENLNWTLTFGSTMMRTSSGNLLVASGNGFDRINYRNYSQTGTLLWSNSVEGDPENCRGQLATHIFEESNHFKIFTNSASDCLQTFNQIQVYTINLSGNFISRKENIIPNSVDVRLKNIIRNGDEFIGTGFTQNLFGVPVFTNLFVARFDENGCIFNSHIAGTVFEDEDLDCTIDQNYTALENWTVIADGPSEDFYGSTDENGVYDLNTFEENYTLAVQLPNAYWGACDTFNVDLSTGSNTVQFDFGIQPLIDCPLLEVDISTPVLRRCFQNDYTVRYCNLGTIGAQDAYVEVILDLFLTIDSTSIPITGQNGRIQIFDIGDVGVGDCGSFHIYATLDCDSTVLGQNHCVQAQIFPDSLCFQEDPSWSGARVELNAECIGDTVQFTIENVGTGPMDEALDYVIIVDDVILRVGNFELDPQQSMTVDEYAGGSTVRMIAQQEQGHPGNDYPSIAIEGCSIDPGNFNLGFVSVFGENDSNPFISIDCQRNRGSYDPNDKIGYPLGYGNENFIAADQEIDYQIRFQNTGTDYAFRVVIIDTLPGTLDPATIRLGASSHNYNYNLSGNGIIEFEFSDIQLPYQSLDDLGSNGFVKFKIKQKEGNFPGTVIQNRAAIYFDFNDPVITEYSIHTIEKPRRFGSQELTWCFGDEFNGIEIFQDTFITLTTEYAAYDSLITTYFDVQAQILTELNVTVNSNEPYMGNIYTTDTTITTNYPITGMCDSMVVTNITVNLIDGIEELNPFGKIQIYPNPTSEKVVILTSKDFSFDLKLQDKLGRTLIDNPAFQNQELDLSKLNAGVYILTLINGHQQWQTKIVKY